jgi:hypothetical protein
MYVPESEGGEVEKARGRVVDLQFEGCGASLLAVDENERS